MNVDGGNENEIKKKIKQSILNRLNKTNDDLCTGIRSSIVSRLNYIVFPFWKLDELLKKF